MKHLRKIISGLLASLACLWLVIAPMNLEAAKNSNKGNGGNSGGNGNNTASTGSNGTGQLVLGAPGVGLDFYVIQKAPFSHSTDIGLYYRYEFTGIEVQCDADGVNGSYSYNGYMWDTRQTDNNGHGNNCDGVDTSNPGEGEGGPNGQTDTSASELEDEWCNVHADHDNDGTPNHSDPDYTGGHFVFGWWNMGAKVNTTFLGDLSFTSAKLHKLSPVKRKYFTTPVVFEAQNITLEWTGTGNSNDPDGHFYILGSAVKEPPVPRGEIFIEMTHYPDGATPEYGWKIERD